MDRNLPASRWDWPLSIAVSMTYLFSPVSKLQTPSRGVRVNILEGVLQDLNHGFRMLHNSPGFTAVAVLTLAFGIGANSTIFSVVNAVLLRPLPYHDSGRLVMMNETTPQMEMSVSYANFLDWEKQNHAFESLGARRYSDFNLTETGNPERIRGMMASAGYLPTLGVRPLLGRVFTAAEDRAGAEPVAVISYGLWKRRFGCGRSRQDSIAGQPKLCHRGRPAPGLCARIPRAAIRTPGNAVGRFEDSRQPSRNLRCRAIEAGRNFGPGTGRDESHCRRSGKGKPA
jgi:hypothetical protein